jgi:hypothetical protein
VIRTRRLQTLALLFALAGVLLRSAIPPGFMPDSAGSAGQPASWLMICPGGELAALQPDMHAHMHQHHGGAAGHGDEHGAHILSEAHSSCPFAAAAAMALPASLAAFDPLIAAVEFISVPLPRRIHSFSALRLPPARAPPFPQIVEVF